MDQLDPNHLDRILEVLQDHGVTQFSCPAFTVTLPLRAGEDDSDSEIAKALQKRQQAQAERTQRLGNYAHPSLWQSGGPPGFPAKAKEESPFKGDE
jgi:hypothetical protein